MRARGHKGGYSVDHVGDGYTHNVAMSVSVSVVQSRRNMNVISLLKLSLIAIMLSIMYVYFKYVLFYCEKY